MSNNTSFFTDYYIQEAIDIISRAIQEHKPKSVWVAYSGGKDSAIALHIASLTMCDINVMAIDTGLAHDNWRETVKRQVAYYNCSNLEFVEGGGKRFFETDVLENGFGYSPAYHTVYYRNLKEDAIDKHIRENKSKKFDRIMYITGVRRAESSRRRKTPDIHRKYARVTVNAIAHFDNNFSDYFHSQYLPHYKNDIYNQWGTNGDCACNWTCGLKLKRLQETSPVLGAWIKELSEKSVNDGGWVYGERPAYGIADYETNGDDMPEDSLCINCTQLKMF